MKAVKYAFGLSILIVFCTYSQGAQYTLGNDKLSRTFNIGKTIYTAKIKNKVSGHEIIPANHEEFRIRISKGTHLDSSDDIILSSDDFTFVKAINKTPEELGFLLENGQYRLKVELHYELEENRSFLNKYMVIKPEKDITLERIDLECIGLSDIYQPYKIKQITARGPAKWRPGLGQPLYTSDSATYWGVEFPAAYNYVEDKVGYCGYLWGRKIEAGKEYTSYKSVVGVGDNPDYIQDAFFEYIDQVRIRPLRLQIQYNSWFDFGRGVNRNNFAGSIKKINRELNVERGVPPLKAYVIDDGWQDTNTDWSDKAWKVNSKFDVDFAASRANAKAAESNLGLWLSPGCLFGAQAAAKRYKQQGFEVLGNWMSMAGPRYMQLLEDRILELTAQGVVYFKLDGVFGHLNIREFELNGNRYGIPYMPQLGTEGLSASDEALNDPRYDELKIYYLAAGTERLMQIFRKQHQVNQDVYVVISNGAYLSPWWLMYIDAVWMINAGDAAGGSNRTQELVYRDNIYYNTWIKEKTQFPINSIFNHEPKKTGTGESPEVFRQYLWMNLSRGTGFIELYIKPQKLSESDWDILAEGLKWAHKVFPYFKHSRMHGGNPGKSEIYGYTGWNENGGYVSFHNPSAEQRIYSFKMDRSNGILPGHADYSVHSALANGKNIEGKVYSTGDVIQLKLDPIEVKVLEFNKVNK